MNGGLNMEFVENSRLIKNDDLNHHGTLFAGRMAEWFVEFTYLGAAKIKGETSLVCGNIHDVKYYLPVTGGEIITFATKVVKVGTSSLLVYGKVLNEKGDKVLEGFARYVAIDENEKKITHNISLGEETDEDREILSKLK